MEDTRFNRLWVAINKAYREHIHCFLNGSGKGTLAYYVIQSSGERFTKNEVRRGLIEAAKRGLIEIGVSSCNYKTFTIKKSNG